MSSIFGSTDIPLPVKNTGRLNNTSVKANDGFRVRQAVVGVKYSEKTHKEGGQEYVDGQVLNGVACVDLVIGGKDHRLCFKPKKEFGGNVSIKKMLVSAWQDARFQEMLQKYAYNKDNYKTVKALQGIKLQLGDGSITTAGALWNDTLHQYGNLHLAPSNAKVTARY